MVGEMVTKEDEREWTNGHNYREELLSIAAQILAAQNAYRADTQEKNIPAIIASAETLICEVNAQCNRLTGGHSDSTSTLPITTPTLPYRKLPSSVRYSKPEKPSPKPSSKSRS